MIVPESSEAHRGRSRNRSVERMLVERVDRFVFATKRSPQVTRSGELRSERIQKGDQVRLVSSAEIGELIPGRPSLAVMRQDGLRERSRSAVVKELGHDPHSPERGRPHLALARPRLRCRHPGPHIVKQEIRVREKRDVVECRDRLGPVWSAGKWQLMHPIVTNVLAPFFADDPSGTAVAVRART